MLSRTADSLYWTGRYMERADFLARILEAAIRLAALPAKDQATVTAWAGAIASSGVKASFDATGRTVSEKSVREYLAFGYDNSTSIKACITKARTNARSVRTALTIELWEAINGAWNGLNELGRTDQARRLHQLPRLREIHVPGGGGRVVSDDVEE